MNCAVIGAGSMLSACSPVPEDMPHRTDVPRRGRPGKIVRATSDDELALILLSADVYDGRAHLHPM